MMKIAKTPARQASPRVLAANVADAVALAHVNPAAAANKRQE